MAAIFLLLMLPGISLAQSSSGKDAQSLLSAFVAYTDLRIDSVQKSLDILSSTSEARTGKWENMKGLLDGYQRADDGLILWFARPDGTYYTVDKGMMDVKLTDRSYFPELMAGRKITVALVISKSTGQRSAVIAVPVKNGQKVIGAIGASVFLDKLSEQVAASLALREGVAFFALAPNGLTTLHSKTDRHFMDPRELGSGSLKEAADKMLSTDSGEVTYEFDKATKKAIYRTSPLTQWRFVLILSAVAHE